MTSVENRIYVIYEGQLISNHLQYYRELEDINREEKMTTTNLKFEFERIKTELLKLFGYRFLKDEDQESLIWGDEKLALEPKRKSKATALGSLGLSLKASYVGDMVERSMEPYDEYERRKGSGKGKEKVVTKFPVIPLFTDGKYLSICLYIYMSICLYFYMSIYLYIYLSLYLYIYLSVFL